MRYPDGIVSKTLKFGITLSLTTQILLLDATKKPNKLTYI